MTVKEFLMKLLPYMNRGTSFYQFRPTVNSKKFTDAVEKIRKVEVKEWVWK